MPSKAELRHTQIRAGTARLCVHMAKETQDRVHEACGMVAQERRPLRHADYKRLERAIKAAMKTLRFLHRLQAMTLEDFDHAPGYPGLEPGSAAQLERALRTGE